MSILFPFFFLNPDNSVDCLKDPVDQEDHLISLQEFYHKRKGQDVHYEKLYVSVTSVVSANFRDESLQSEQPGHS